MKEEIFPIVNEKDEVIGKATRKECHSGSNLLHPVIHVHIINDEGKLYIQKRSPEKDLLPNYWDTAVGGHVMYGETILDAVKRESKEELGIDINFDNIMFLGTYISTNNNESELVHVYRIKYNGPINWQDGEVVDGKFMTIEEIKNANLQYTPNFLEDIDKFSEYLV